MLGIALAAIIQTAEPNSSPSGDAADTDCAVVVAIAKSVLHWGAKQPDFSLDPEFDVAFGGRGASLPECPWEKLGVVKPAIATPESLNRFWISRPSYDAAGMTASANIMVIQKPPKDHPERRPFFEMLTCTVSKGSQVWTVANCKVAAIS